VGKAGADGGYALQFSRKKLVAAIETVNKTDGLNYELEDVHYTVDNPMKTEVLSHTDAFIHAYMGYLDELAKPLDFSEKTMRSPIADLPGRPLAAFLDYLVHTKNIHFREERECRLSLIQLVSTSACSLPVQYFNRGGLLVPYTKTPRSSFNVLDCVEWIVIGAGPRMSARFKSVIQLVRQSGRKIKVRASHISQGSEAQASAAVMTNLPPKWIDEGSALDTRHKSKSDITARFQPSRTRSRDHVTCNSETYIAIRSQYPEP